MVAVRIVINSGFNSLGLVTVRRHSKILRISSTDKSGWCRRFNSICSWRKKKEKMNLTDTKCKVRNLRFNGRGSNRILVLAVFVFEHSTTSATSAL